MESLESRAKIEEQSVYSPLVENEFDSFDRIYEKLSKQKTEGKVKVGVDNDHHRQITCGSLAIVRGNLNGKNFIYYKVKTEKNDVVIAYVSQDMFDPRKKDAEFRNYGGEDTYYMFTELPHDKIKGTVLETIEANPEETVRSHPVLGKYETMILSDLKTVAAEDPERDVKAPSEEQVIIASLQSRNMDLQKKEEELQEENAGLKSENTDLKSKNEELQKELEALRAERDKAKQQVGELQEILTSNQEKLGKIMGYLQAKHPFISKRFKDEPEDEQK